MGKLDSGVRNPHPATNGDIPTMKSELQAKFLHHLISKKKGNEGFTLIELLVVIIIIGILAAIALPSFLNQANKARQSEAETYIGSLNRGQQAYYLEKSDFGATIDALGIGVPTSTDYYKYDTKGSGSGVAAKATSTATKQKGTVKEYSGIVWLTQDATSKNYTSLAKVCPDTLTCAS